MEWITDRLPTKEDADSYGDVVVALEHPDGWDVREWSCVHESTPWLAFKPAPKPPAPEQAAATTAAYDLDPALADAIQAPVIAEIQAQLKSGGLLSR